MLVGLKPVQSHPGRASRSNHAVPDRSKAGQITPVTQSRSRRVPATPGCGGARGGSREADRASVAGPSFPDRPEYGCCDPASVRACA